VPWRGVNGTVVNAGGRFSVLVQPSAQTRFYRLRGGAVAAAAIMDTSPAAGEGGVAVTRETILRFSESLAQGTVLSVDRFQALFGGRRILARTELSSDRRTATLFYLENLPASATITVRFDGTGIRDAKGTVLDADGDGIEGGVFTMQFNTLGNTPLNGTGVIGHVFAAEMGPGGTNRPLQGVTITVDGAEESLRVVTDANGFFRLQPAPAGRFFVHIDGRTALGSAWPSGAYYPTVGKAWEGAVERWGDVYDPATGQRSARVAFATSEVVDAAVEAAARAQGSWRNASLATRTRVMFAFRQLVEKHKSELAHLLTREHGKVLSDAMGEVSRGLEVVEFACGLPQLLKGEFSENVSTDVDSYSIRQPLGVVAGITPFNFPAMVPMWMYPLAIACGNAFILKPSEKDPSAANLSAQLLADAGLPEGVFSVVHGDKAAVDAILAHPGIAAVSFVGSTPIARHIYETATRAGKRVQALGGAKNHMVVLPDADMDLAADSAVNAGYGSAGERCMAISVLVAVGDAADRLLPKIRERIRKLKVAPGLEPGAEMGPLVTKEHHARVVGYVEKGEAEGATLLEDGRTTRIAGHEAGFFLGPCLFDGVRPDMATATVLPMFWIKLAFPAALVAGGAFAVSRLARPGAFVAIAPWLLAAPLVTMGSLAAIELAAAAPPQRAALLMGETWQWCPLVIALLSLPALAALLWAMRGLAPTRLALAGGAAGLLAGSVGALVYALHCTEMAAPFLSIWYVAGVLIPVAAAALLGPRLLRW
jgi:malonate-semialdehyde dehydrogenase (acetylating)/methylmalonate-semialdehyde dehydrogenase